MVYLPLFDGARNWATQGAINYFEIFSRRVAASSNYAMHSDGGERLFFKSSSVAAAGDFGRSALEGF
jgi:hypothetical protein